MQSRTYPIVRTITCLIPELAQARLRELQTSGEAPSDQAWFLEGVLLGMGIEPERAKVHLGTMTVEVTL